LYVLATLIFVGAGAVVAIFFVSNHSSRPVVLPDSSPSSTAATYVKQHSLLLINESPHPGQAGSGPMTSSIYTVHPDGTGKTLLTNNGGAPSWTPDGKISFASSRSGSQQIWVMDANGSNAHQIGNLPASTLPVMPQEGENGLIVFMGSDATTEPDGNTGIWMMQRDGSGLKELVHGMQPSLALSGTWIAYTLQTDTPYHREIWRINTDGTGLKQLTFLGDDPDYPDANAPNISPDEQTMAFFSGKESDRAVPGAPQQPVFTFGHRNVAIVPATGGARTTLTPCQPVTTQAELDAATEASGNCIAADNPAWTPDSKWLIFDMGFSTGGGTWMVDVNGQNYQQFYSEGRGIVRVPLKWVN
jgi:Tol biopolymer transport system component